jgi:hypothetical protein
MRQLLLATLIAAVLAPLLATAADKAAIAAALTNRDDGDGRSSAAGFTSKVVLEAQEGKGVGTLRIARLDPLTIENFLRTALTVSTPFDSSKADSVDIGTLSGLTTGSGAKLEVGALIWPFVDAGPLENICETEIPKLIEGAHWTVPPPDHLEGLTTKTPHACEEALFDRKVLQEIVERVNKERMQKWQATAQTLQLQDKPVPEMPPKLVLVEHARSEPIIKRAIERLRLGNAEFKGLHSITLGLSANRNDYSYVLLEDPTASKESERRGRGLSLAYTRVAQSVVANVGFQYERSYKAGKFGQVCTPIQDTSSLQCVGTVIGAPAEKTRKIAFVEARRIFSGRLPIAVSPRVEYDAEESEFALSVPVYMIPSGDGSLIGGLKLGWSEEEDAGVSVFFGKAFSFFD